MPDLTILYVSSLRRCFWADTGRRGGERGGGRGGLSPDRRVPKQERSLQLPTPRPGGDRRGRVALLIPGGG